MKEKSNKYILETERLQLREFNLEDTPFVIELLNSKGWLQFIGDRNIKTEEQAQNYLINGPLKSYVDNGFGLWLVGRKSDQKPLGMCGIIKRQTLPNPDIGFAFLPEFAGQGYAYEIASAVLLYAKNDLKITKIAAIILPENIKSIRLIEKLQFNFVKTISFPPENEALQLYGNYTE